MTDQVMYAVLAVATEINGTVFGRTLPIELAWADGMIGVLPVFNSKESAMAYSGHNVGVVALTEVAKDGVIQ